VELLDKPEEQTAPIRIGRFVLYGGGLNLNGMYLRHVTLTNVHSTNPAKSMHWMTSSSLTALSRWTTCPGPHISQGDSWRTNGQSPAHAVLGDHRTRISDASVHKDLCQAPSRR